MNQTYTREQIIAAFKEWMQKVSESPEDFVTFETMLASPEKSAEEQAEYFLSLLEKKPS